MKLQSNAAIELERYAPGKIVSVAFGEWQGTAPPPLVAPSGAVEWSRARPVLEKASLRRQQCWIFVARTASTLIWSDVREGRLVLFSKDLPS